jgi:serine/threonine protein kinase
VWYLSVMPLAPGLRLGPYEILTPIGAGGMGEVYKARDIRLSRDVALKVLPPQVAGDADRLRRFEQEAQAAAALNHPNILAVHDIGREGDLYFIVSELLEGQTLRDLVRESALPVRKAIDYAAQVARGLAAAHERGIIHRDITPENLILTSDGRVKILDLGLAKVQPSTLAADASGTATVALTSVPGTVLGTVGYMSPEQIRGVAVDHRTDIFSLGLVLHEMLTGQRAFQGD